MIPIRDTIPSKNTPVGTWIMIMANSVVFVFELMMPDLRLDLAEEKRHKWDVTDQLPMIERFDAETAETLRRILAEEDNHQAQLTDMLMRSDPLSEYPPS